MLVYVASPYAGLCVNEASRKSLALEVARKECLKLTKESEAIVPVSPVLLFSTLFDEKSERGRILQMCKELLKTCDYIYLSTHKDAENSKGMAMEALLAQELGIRRLELALPLG